MVALDNYQIGIREPFYTFRRMGSVTNGISKDNAGIDVLLLQIRERSIQGRQIGMNIRQNGEESGVAIYGFFKQCGIIQCLKSGAIVCTSIFNAFNARPGGI